jgi:predicted RND superfamily exporter protein
MHPSLASEPQTRAVTNAASGSFLERAIFNHRAIIVVLCTLVTVLLTWQASRLHLNASFEKTIPTYHPYVQNYLRHQADLAGLGNAVRIAVANPKGSIYDAAYLDTLQRLSDEVFLVPGVARNQTRVGSA